MGTYKVGEGESGLKLSAFIHQKHPTLSLRHIKKCLEQNCAQVNGRVETFYSYIVCKGEVIQFEERQASSAMPILFEDESFLFIDKPPYTTVEEAQKAMTYRLVHRLDKETSGVLMFAKNEEAFQAALELFRARQVNKEYIAIVDGVPAKPSGTIENYLGKVASYEGHTIWGVVSKGALAKTRWQRGKTLKDRSEIFCYPETGRTHQIRIHMASLSHPILGDRTYGKTFRSSYIPPRILLHARRLQLTHPFTLKPLKIEAPEPHDIKRALDEHPDY